MDFENPTFWEALLHEAEKAKVEAEERCSQLSPSSNEAMDEHYDLQTDINQYEIAIKIAKLALKVAGVEEEPAPVETPRKWQNGDTVWWRTPTAAYEGKVYGHGSIANRYHVILSSPPQGIEASQWLMESELSNIPF